MLSSLLKAYYKFLYKYIGMSPTFVVTNVSGNWEYFRVLPKETK